MGFETRVTFAYTGEPSKGAARLKIVLADGTTLIATDNWTNYPQWDLVLHPLFLPERVARARTTLVKELRQTGHNVKTADIAAHLSRNLAEGHKGVRVVLRYGRVAVPTRIVVFDSTITQLLPM